MLACVPVGVLLRGAKKIICATAVLTRRSGAASKTEDLRAEVYCEGWREQIGVERACEGEGGGEC